MIDVIIIGCGAAGLMAAITAKKSDKNLNVTILERNSSPGKKILKTGNGKCNLTNLDLSSDKYYSYSDKKDDFLNTLFNEFDEKDTLEFFESIGVCTENKDNYVYPKAMQAGVVVNALFSEALLLGVKCNFNEDVKSITKNNDKGNDKFVITTGNNSYFADKLLISTGTKAGLSKNEIHNFEINDYIKKNHKFYDLVPSLCGLNINKNGNEEFLKKVKGVRTKAKLIIEINNKKIDFTDHRNTGELQLTDYGLSGIVVFQISSVVAKHIKSEKVNVNIDFLPDLPIEEVLMSIKKFDYIEKRNITDILSAFLNVNLSMALISLYGKRINKNISVNSKNIGFDELEKIISFVKNVSLNIHSLNNYDKAQVMKGGIDIESIGKNMESKNEKNLFFAGEIIDIDGICGGYNLQFAWTSGYVAGRNIADDKD